jgi:hypothetical protein
VREQKTSATLTTTATGTTAPITPTAAAAAWPARLGHGLHERILLLPQLLRRLHHYRDDNVRVTITSAVNICNNKVNDGSHYYYEKRPPPYNQSTISSTPLMPRFQDDLWKVAFFNNCLRPSSNTPTNFPHPLVLLQPPLPPRQHQSQSSELRCCHTQLPPLPLLPYLPLIQKRLH